jgi:hypothetical protein
MISIAVLHLITGAREGMPVWLTDMQTLEERKHHDVYLVPIISPATCIVAYPCDDQLATTHDHLARLR